MCLSKLFFRNPVNPTQREKTNEEFPAIYRNDLYAQVFEHFSASFELAKKSELRYFE